MIDETCPICKERRESIIDKHLGQMGILHNEYAKQVADLQREHEANMMRQAERKMLRLEIVELAHAEHARGETSVIGMGRDAWARLRQAVSVEVEDA